jgi:peptide-methionine (S)-S-oxide reductase
MTRHSLLPSMAAIVLGAAWSAACSSSRAETAVVPAFAGAAAAPAADGAELAVLAGGCFWGVDAVFKHVKGVVKVVSGYAGGAAATADYETVSSGSTGHAESVQITFDARVVSYAQLLQVFFAVAHDPTQLNRQGPDRGSQYRSAIFYVNDTQKQIAHAYINQLESARAFESRIVTQVTPLNHFYAAEGYHQNYLALHPNQPYIIFNDLPKVASLRSNFPSLYRP